MHIYRHRWQLSLTDALGNSSLQTISSGVQKPILPNRKFERNANVYAVSSDGVSLKIPARRLIEVHAIKTDKLMLFSAHPFYAVIPRS